MSARNFRSRLTSSVAVPAIAFAGLTATPLMAQGINPDEIIVTARRTEERLQDVPISITVFSGDQIQKRNIAVASDLAVFTPSLSVNTRYGPEKSTFSIRGFNQDASTAPTVGVYFADVVGVRAQGGTAGGNTVGAGAFTDLQNVQVLKGPQGTLQGRNTTGGAVLLVPAKPTDLLEASIEGTYGNYDQKRVQAMFNAPLADTFKVRVAIDRNERDGYMKNHSGVGPKDFNDVNYFYGRLSVVADLTPNLENYTIFHYSRSDTNGYASHYEFCDSNPGDPRQINPATISPINPNGSKYSISRYYTSLAACDQIARQTARGDGPLDVDVSDPDPRMFLRTWQAINTTTWQASDTITIKNIVSYGEYREQSQFQLYSDNFTVPDTAITRYYAARRGPQIGQPFDYIQLGTQPGHDAAAESTTTEELQIQGRSADGKFNFVVGGYLEFSRPLGYNQQRTGIYGNCVDPGVLNCSGGLPLSDSAPIPGTIISESRTQLAFDNHGVFAQGTYRFTDQLALTLGGRWTFDKIAGYSESNRRVFASVPGVGYVLSNWVCNDNLNHATVNLIANGGDLTACGTRITVKSNKPTWLIDLDFKPTPDTLIYAKYARGYRQGTVNFTNPGLETALPEKVDAYEVGAKLTFRGALPGYLNVAGFWNDFSNQQVFGALIPKPESGLVGGSAIINAGKSVIRGVEVDAGVTPFQGLRLSAGYAYLDTKLKDLVTPTLSADSPFLQIIPRGRIGGPLTYSPKHKLTLSGDYSVPLGDNIGELNFGVVFTYTARQFVDGNLQIPGYSLLNLNAGITDVGGSGFDVVVFAQNVTNKHYRTTSGGGYDSSGIGDFMYGPPRMYGVRLKYAFGR
ncbi:TonB-dependent receptor [Novosphingobium resinovorum]|uniref:TonB-dependent receptor n=1 Tax=Sphingomonadaceae TaxID=41297 RepID=UPI00027C9FBF|nr:MULTISPECIES: TonB-dependent receptor [Sphingomonadaceae]EJU10992.1 TonB-dependent receptor [Sphingomonas sp. LH128]MBF7012199.1 TonB-dependent receptor [Novosphingobium sp. HR1a]WJM26945.1 TonB-dependent receptor [Novosphingobium resinovorum]